MTERVYLDSNIVIYIVERSPAHAGVVTEALRRAPEATLVTSDLVRMECLVGALRRPDTAIRDRYTAFLDRTLGAPLGRDAFLRAAELRAALGLKTPDALHLAAALEAGCEEFWTNDRRLDAAQSLIRVARVG